MKIELIREDLLDLQITLKKEYLLTNSLGAYCSSTLHDCHTRKYHGLLVCPVAEQKKIYNLVSKIEVNTIIGKKSFHLSTNKFPKVYHPTGHKYVSKLEYDDFPVTTYTIGKTVIRKSILMPENEPSVLVKYEVLQSEQPVLFQANPLLAYRDIHSLAKENMDIKPRTYFEPNGFKIDPYQGLPPVYIQTSIKSKFYPSPEWWRNFEYLKERNRGYEYQEDLFTPGMFEFKLSEGKSVIFRASLHTAKGSITSSWNNEIKRLKTQNTKIEGDKEPLLSLKKKASLFHFKTQTKKPGIIAGFPWFREWGRDTMISLPGLTWMIGNKKAGLDILRKYAGLEKNGMLPNMVSEFDENHSYLSVDVALLYIKACQDYLKATKDKGSLTKYTYAAMENIISAYLNNKIPGLSLSNHGFLFIHDASKAVTWMDAWVDGQPVTPRCGAPIEINALFYNALQFLLHEFKHRLPSDMKEQMMSVSKQYEMHFEDCFWNESDACYHDIYEAHQGDGNFIRPNQLYALGLKYSPVSQEKAKRAIETIKSHLVTSYGLRSLSPRNPRYRAEYKGDQQVRDQAYHNGMVWPYFVGIFMDALLKYASIEEVEDYIKSTFWKLWDKHLDMYGLFQISEIFRPNPPQVAKGSIAQAWSHAEVIRVLETLNTREGI